MSKIIKLTAENVKRLSAVEIKPDGNMVVIGGRNGQGKSSCLDAIEYALGGDPSAKMPVRRGEDKAKVVVDLGDIVVRRTFTSAGGTSLVVTNADGVKQMSPQAILDKLVGTLTFDPLQFSREKPKQQADIMRKIVGLDFTQQDAEREKTFNDRTAVNREVKALESRMAAMPKHDDAPKEEVSAAEILAQQSAAAKMNSQIQQERQMAKEAEATALNGQVKLELHDRRMSDISDQISRLQQDLEKLKAQRMAALPAIQEANNEAERLRKRAEALKDVDLEPFKAKISECETANRKVRENRQRAEVVKQYKAATEQAESLSRKIEAIDAAKRRAVTEAKYPVPGLEFDASGGVTLNGIPFEQCSSAEQLKVSVAVGIALNPKLRVLLIRDGSLLDDDSMKSLLEMAKAADAQVWIERVEAGAGTSVIIEDGRVQEKVEEPKEDA